MYSFHILVNEFFHLFPKNDVFRLALAFQFGIASIVEVAMAGIGDDEQLLVPWHRIWHADCINYVKGANVAGFMKVAKAMMAQGLV